VALELLRGSRPGPFGALAGIPSRRGNPNARRSANQTRKIVKREAIEFSISQEEESIRLHLMKYHWEVS
jgi:hypothetical protein